MEIAFLSVRRSWRRRWYFQVGSTGGSYFILHCIFASTDFNYKFMACNDIQSNNVDIYKQNFKYSISIYMHKRFARCFSLKKLSRYSYNVTFNPIILLLSKCLKVSNILAKSVGLNCLRWIDLKKTHLNCWDNQHFCSVNYIMKALS